MDTFKQLSVPKYRHIKNTFEIFDARVKRLDSGITVNTKYLNHMKDIRTRVRKLLKSHKLYNELDIIISRKINDGDVPEEILESLTKLSKPRLKDLKESLMKVNQMIRTIVSDYYYKDNTLKMKRYAELMEYRKNICCLLKNAKFPSDPHICHRFAPCQKKIVDVWEIPIEGKPNSRMLKVDFDETTTKLAHPQYLRIRSTLEFFNRLRYYYIYKTMEEGRWSEKELKQIYASIENIDKKIIHLQQLERMAKRTQSYDEGKIAQASSRSKSNGKYKDFTNSIELPRRKRLEDALKSYQLYLEEIQKRIGNKNNNEALSEGRIQPLIQRIERNIVFTQNLLDILPADEPHCQLGETFDEVKQKKMLFATYDQSGRKKYIFDEKTNEMAFPKLGILENCKIVQQKVLEKFEHDLKNIEKVKQSKERNDPINESEHNDDLQGTTDNDNKADKKYQQLKERINRLNALIQQKKETNEYLQSILPQPGVRSTYFHHKLCFKKDDRKIIIPIYKALKPHSAISTSKAATKYIQSSVDSYIKWIEERKNDIKYRDEIESTLNNLKSSEKLTASDEAQELDEEEKSSLKQESTNKKTHTQRMIQNKLKLETYLESIESTKEDDIHLQTHAKFEKGLKPMKSDKVGIINRERMMELAMPKRTLLKFSIVRFRHLMSEHKRRRLECRLSKNLARPEQMERELRQKTPQKIAKMHHKSKTSERVAINQVLNKIMYSNELAEKNSMKFDDLIRYSILNGLQICLK